MKLLADDVWQTIKDYTLQYKNFELTEDCRTVLCQVMDIYPFDGGVFIAYGNEFDLFVVPNKRGKWKIRSQCKQFIDDMHKRHDTIIAKIHESNAASLRLAIHFGFKETHRIGDLFVLEHKNG